MAKLLWTSDDLIKDVIPSTQLYPAAVVSVKKGADAYEVGKVNGSFVISREGDKTQKLSVAYTLSRTGSNPGRTHLGLLTA